METPWTIKWLSLRKNRKIRKDMKTQNVISTDVRVESKEKYLIEKSYWLITVKPYGCSCARVKIKGWIYWLKNRIYWLKNNDFFSKGTEEINKKLVSWKSQVPINFWSVIRFNFSRQQFIRIKRFSGFSPLITWTVYFATQ